MEPIFTPAELEQVRAYAAPHYAWLALRDVVTVGIFLLLLRFVVRPLFARSEGVARALDERLSFLRRVPVVRALPAVLEKLWGGPGWGAALLFTLFFLTVVNAVFLPKSVYLGFIHEHRFGQSNYTGPGFAWDLFKGFVLGAFAQCAVAFGLFGLSRRLKHWWLALGVVAALGLLAAPLLDPYRARVFFEQERLGEGEVRAQIDGLLDRAEVPYGDVLVEKTSRASKNLQAYFAGQGPTRTVVLNDVLLETLSADEVLAAVAHEAGHIHEPRWPSHVLGALAMLCFLYGVHRLLALSAARGWLGITSYGDVRCMPLILLGVTVLLNLVQPVGAAVSRARERKADTYALELTQDPDAFRRMLVKAARTNKLDPQPPTWAVIRAHSHPPIAERLRAVSDWEAKLKTSGR